MDAIALLKAEKKRLQELKQENSTSSLKVEPLQPPPSLLSYRQPSSVAALPIGDERVTRCVTIYSNFITSEEEAFLLKATYSDGSPWQVVRNRRLQCFGGDPVPGATRCPLPSWVEVLARFVERSVSLEYAIDHVLLNEYQVGQGILPHTDGPSYYPCVACLSIGDACGDMLFQEKLKSDEIGVKNAKTLLTVTLMPRSLIVFHGFAYTDALHSIENVSGGKARVSLTMRKIMI